MQLLRYLLMYYTSIWNSFSNRCASWRVNWKRPSAENAMCSRRTRSCSGCCLNCAPSRTRTTDSWWNWRSKWTHSSWSSESWRGNFSKLYVLIDFSQYWNFVLHSHQNIHSVRYKIRTGKIEKWSWSLSETGLPGIAVPPGATTSHLDLLSEFGIISDGWLGFYISFGDWVNILEFWRSPSLRLQVISGIAVPPGVTHSDSHHRWYEHCRKTSTTTRYSTVQNII